jgi:Flp pilus assembly protein TadD
VSPEQTQAVDAIKAGDFAKASELLTSLRSKEPKNAEVVFYSGVAAEGLNNLDDAQKYYRQAMDLDPKLADAPANLSALLINQEQYDAAMKVIQQGLKGAPDHDALLNNQAVALMGKGDAKGAAQVYDHLVSKNPQNDELRVNEAEAWFAAGDKDHALKIAGSLLHSDQRAVLASVADLHARMGAFEPCVTALTRAIGLHDAAELHISRGMCEHGLKQEQKATEDFQKATEIDSKSAVAFYYLGRSLAAAGLPARAKEAFKKAASLDTNGKIGQAASKAAAELH